MRAFIDKKKKNLYNLLIWKSMDEMIIKKMKSLYL